MPICTNTKAHAFFSHTHFLQWEFAMIFSQPNGNLIIATETFLEPKNYVKSKNEPPDSTYIGVVDRTNNSLCFITKDITTSPYEQLKIQKDKSYRVKLAIEKYENYMKIK